MKEGLYLPWFTQCDILTIKAYNQFTQTNGY